MSFQNLLGHTLTVSQLTATTGYKRTYQGSTTYAAFIQPLSDNYALSQGMAASRVYKAFVEYGANISIGDNVTDQKGYNYKVTGIKLRDYGTFPHLSVIMEQQLKVNPNP